eukprot:UN10220
MAGSGKTTLMKLLGERFVGPQDEDEDSAGDGYFINLDPAILTKKANPDAPADEAPSDLPYFADIDIRDTIKYKEVMNQHGLGPNGSIVVSLNLFATKFDQVLNFCEKRSEEAPFAVSDRPLLVKLKFLHGLHLVVLLHKCYPHHFQHVFYMLLIHHVRSE